VVPALLLRLCKTKKNCEDEQSLQSRAKLSNANKLGATIVKADAWLKQSCAKPNEGKLQQKAN